MDLYPQLVTTHCTTKDILLLLYLCTCYTLFMFYVTFTYLFYAFYAMLSAFFLIKDSNCFYSHYNCRPCTNLCKGQVLLTLCSNRFLHPCCYIKNLTRVNGAHTMQRVLEGLTNHTAPFSVCTWMLWRKKLLGNFLLGAFSLQPKLNNGTSVQ